MRHLRRCYLPVRPLLCPTIANHDGAEGVEAEPVVDVEVKNLKDFAVLGEPIVGIDKVVLDDRGQGALPPKMMPSPNEPTPAARALHRDPASFASSTHLW